MRIRILVLALMFISGRAVAQATDPAPIPIAPPAKDPTKAPPRPPEMGKLTKVDFDKGIFEHTLVKYRIVNKTRIETVQIGNRTVKRPVTVSEKVPVMISVRGTLKGIKIYDAAGFALSEKEIRKRLKSGVSVAWSQDAKATASHFAKMLKKDTLILVDPKRKAPMPKVPVPSPKDAPIRKRSG